MANEQGMGRSEVGQPGDEKALILSGVNPARELVHPPGGNQSSSGGNENWRVSGTEGRKGDLASVQAIT